MNGSCANCGATEASETIEEGDYEFLDGRETFPLYFCGDGCLGQYMRVNYGEFTDEFS